MSKSRSESGETTTARPMKKRLFRILVLCLSGFLLLEFACFLYLSFNGVALTYWSTLQAERSAVIEKFASIPEGESVSTETANPGPADLVLHPYLGFTRDPSRDQAVNEYGLLGRTDPIQSRSADKIILGIVGGDVAERFFESGLPAVAETLRNSEAFAGKEVVLVNLACSGFKQPQQLNAVNYMLAMGAEFDMIVNLDGFNEVALHDVENSTKNVSPFYPRNWYLLNSDVPDPRLRQLIGHQEYLESELVQLARTMSKAPLRYSATWNALWHCRYQNLRREHDAVRNGIRNYKTGAKQETPYWLAGPPIPGAPELNNQFNLAIWAESSWQLHLLCRENKIKYFHFLQPSQFVFGAKPMGTEERAVALSKTNPYTKSGARGYQSLVSAGPEFKRLGIRFTDLTRVFADVSQQVYVNETGQLNEEGHKIIAGHVATAIIKD